MNEIVPFGKYKGQPLEAMLADADYCGWLQAQGWFGARYAEFKTVIINHGARPNETPEHNALQARFINDESCLRLWWLVGAARAQPMLADLASTLAEPEPLPARTGGEEERRTLTPVFDPWAALPAAERRLDGARAAYAKVSRPAEGEDDGGVFDRAQLELGRALHACAALDMALASPGTHGGRILAFPVRVAKVLRYRLLPSGVDSRSFEEKGWDVFFRVRWRIVADLDDGSEAERGSGESDLCCELKPCLGDDYPAVLRQVKSYETPIRRWSGHHQHRVVVAGSFAARGASIEQVRAIFATSGISFVLLGELPP